VQQLPPQCIHCFDNDSWALRRIFNLWRILHSRDLLETAGQPRLIRSLNIYVWSILPHAVNCGRFCFWRRQYGFFMFVYEISPGTAEQICAKFTRKMCLVPRLDEFESQGQRSRSPRTNTAFLALSAVRMQFMFGKTSLASSMILLLPTLSVQSMFSIHIEYPDFLKVLCFLCPIMCNMSEKTDGVGCHK